MAGRKSVECRPRTRVRGTLRPPGDKSISHRALILGSVAGGPSRIAGLSPGADVRATRSALEKLGVQFTDDRSIVTVHGRGWQGLHQPGGWGAIELDCANSGTTARLMLGLLAGGRGEFRLTGDDSLRRRPMGRVVRPLRRLGAAIDGEKNLPLVVHGKGLRGGVVESDVPSAQVRSALIFAALQAEGESLVVTPPGTRDHTERMLAAMGVFLEEESPEESEEIREGEESESLEESQQILRVAGGSPRLAPLDLTIPGDPSAAAYFVALACLRPESDLVVENLLLNETRMDFYRLLRRMGAQLVWDVERDEPEPVGRLYARGSWESGLSGIELDSDDVRAAIDEIPLLAVVAAVADGPTQIRGAGELRVKESDRLAATARLLRAFGAEVEEFEDGLVVMGGARLHGADVDSEGDHRIAMCAAIAAALADGASLLTGAEWVDVSYPEFFADLDRLTE